MNSLAIMMAGRPAPVQRLVPLDRDIGCVQRLPLPPERGADLDQMDDHRLAEIRHDLHRPQRVEHHGAAAGAELDQPHILRRPIAARRRRPDPISSPNIWLISGAVTKSPLAPNGSRVV